LYLCKTNKVSAVEKCLVFSLTIVLLFVSQRAVAMPECGVALVGDVAIIDESVACCDNDDDLCCIASRAVAIKTGKKKSQLLEKFYTIKNRIKYKNQVTTNFQGINFLPQSFFDVYSGSKVYLLTNGD